MFRTAKIQRNILILIGIISLSYVLILLLSPKDITDYTVADTEYWRETGNRLLLKTSYDYNSKESVESFPKTLGDWKGIDFKYPDSTYGRLNADMLVSRAYTNNRTGIIWMDIINSKVGESFHKQKICVQGAGWTIDNESVVEFKIADPPNPFTKLYANRLDISKKDRKQVMIYWFMLKKFGSKDSVTMIRLSVPVRSNGTDEAFDAEKGFIESQLFDAMYEKADVGRVTMYEYVSRGYGNTGRAAIIVALLIPMTIILIGARKKD